MNKLLRIILSALLATGGSGIIFFAGLLLLQAPDWIVIGGAIFILAIGIVFVIGGVRIAYGASISEVLVDLFRTLGR